MNDDRLTVARAAVAGAVIFGGGAAFVVAVGLIGGWLVSQLGSAAGFVFFFAVIGGATCAFIVAMDNADARAGRGKYARVVSETGNDVGER